MNILPENPSVTLPPNAVNMRYTDFSLFLTFHPILTNNHLFTRYFKSLSHCLIFCISTSGCCSSNRYIEIRQKKLYKLTSLLISCLYIATMCSLFIKKKVGINIALHICITL